MLNKSGPRKGLDDPKLLEYLPTGLVHCWCLWEAVFVPYIVAYPNEVGTTFDLGNGPILQVLLHSH